MNSVRFHVPYTVCDFTRRELDELTANGPYIEPWEAILPALDPVRVQRELIGLQLEYHKMLASAIEEAGKPRQQMSFITLVKVLLDYPPDDPGGPTAMTWLDVIEKCNTQSHEDLRKIIKHGWMNSGLEKPIIQIMFGDGQTVGRASPPRPCHATTLAQPSQPRVRRRTRSAAQIPAQASGRGYWCWPLPLACTLLLHRRVCLLVVPHP